jgi:hypothetical protein
MSVPSTPRPAPRAAAAALGLFLAVASGTPGCEGDRECYPTDWRACACGDGAPGYQQCDDAGEAYGACDCTGTIPGLTTGAAASGGAGQGGGSAGAGGATLKKFMEECGLDEDCETGLCHFYMGKGASLCSKSCTGAADCPPPSPGCNLMGICKAP